MTQRTRILARLKTANRNVRAAGRIALGLLGREADTIRIEEDEAADEADAWMDARGFRLVLHPLKNRYADGFDPDTEYEFMRAEWEAPSVFRMRAQHELFNIAGLRFRPIVRDTGEVKRDE